MCEPFEHFYPTSFESRSSMAITDDTIGQEARLGNRP